MLDSTANGSIDDDRFWRLVSVVTSSEASDSEQEELDAAIRSSTVRRRQYVEYRVLHAELWWRFRTVDLGESHGAKTSDGDPAGRGIPMAISMPLPLGDLLPDLSSGDGVVGGRSGNGLGSGGADGPLGFQISWPSVLPFAGLTAVAFAVLLLIWRFTPTPVANDGPVAERNLQTPSPSVVGRRARVVDEVAAGRSFVARLARVSGDLAWGEDSAPRDFLLRVRAGERLVLAAGSAQLEFNCGATILLTAPAIFTPTGAASAHLESGRLTGEVSKGNFRLLTPTAEVVDLGTAFGVIADAKVGTEVVVFDGKVQIKPRFDGVTPSAALDMTAGMAARVRSDGSTEYGVESEVSSLVRAVRDVEQAHRADTICLVDILGGGDGATQFLAGAIDPTSGVRDSGDAPGVRCGDGRFHPVEWHSIINGVFVPSREGGACRVDSLGGAIQLPPTNGLTWGPLWARRWDGGLASGDAAVDFWSNGTLKHVLARLKDCRSGIVGMHANVGFTLDLRALRMLHRAPALEFHATVANLDNSRDINPHIPDLPERLADLLVFVDGDLRFSRTRFRRDDGDAEVKVEIGDSDRFLTIISTDSTGDSSYDHVILIDPVILLHRN